VADQVPGRAGGRVGGAVPDRSQHPAQVELGHLDLDEPPGGQVLGDSVPGEPRCFWLVIAAGWVSVALIAYQVCRRGPAQRGDARQMTFVIASR
jgi:hypothetical protein